jgi:hypothetical protein
METNQMSNVYNDFLSVNGFHCLKWYDIEIFVNIFLKLDLNISCIIFLSMQ